MDGLAPTTNSLFTTASWFDDEWLPQLDERVQYFILFHMPLFGGPHKHFYSISDGERHGSQRPTVITSKLSQKDLLQDIW